MDANSHYREPGLMTRKVLNPTVSILTKAGISVWGSRVLEVPGRKSGDLRRTPVNLLELDGRQYLVSARGNGQWVRNVRAADGKLALLLGRHRDERKAEEVRRQREVAHSSRLPSQVEVRSRALLRWGDGRLRGE